MIIKCTKCDHEWQVAKGAWTAEASPHMKCDWCGAPGEKIADDWIDCDKASRRALARALRVWFDEETEKSRQ